MLKPEWKPRPFSSCLGFMDIKKGVVIALMFTVRIPALKCYRLFIYNQLFNKVAGVYGLIAVLTGAGGSAAQLSLYIYSTFALVALAWGLKAVNKVSCAIVYTSAPQVSSVGLRRILGKPSTLHTRFSPITSSQPLGQCISLFRGGFTHRTTGAAWPTRQRSSPSSKTTQAKLSIYPTKSVLWRPPHSGIARKDSP